MPDPSADKPAPKTAAKADAPWRHPLRLADLPSGKPTRLTLEPEAEARAALARALELDDLRKLRFAVELKPAGKQDWQLSGQLGATVVQPCVVTGQPVTTRIEEPVIRRYTAHLPDIPAEPGAELEMPEDDTLEPLPDTLDLGAVMQEALALALPLYPRAEGVDPVELSAAPPGTAPMSDEDARPFAALKGLRDKLRDEE